MSYRKRDSNVEREIANYLDKFLYPKVCESFFRFTEKEDQLKGKDIEIEIGQIGKIIVDEKAASHYINKDIKTFAFELSFCRRNGERVQGWLLDKSKVTEYYLLMWIEAETQDIWNLKMNDISLIKGVLLNRKSLIQYLKKEGYSHDRIENMENEIINQKLDGALYKTEHDSIYFYSTLRLSEKPINIIVSRRKLEQLSNYRFLIRKDQLEVLPPLV